jgi:endonuclease/exonuclease/phosphatase family metal-dependent hydrolase
VSRQPEQAELVAAAGADLVCLQEVIPRAAPLWRESLRSVGLTHVSVSDPAAATTAGRTRPLLVLTATRQPHTPREVENVPWPERVLACTVDGLEVVNVHSPISPKPDLAKIRTHEAVHSHLAAGSGPRLCCGDLNTPRREHPDGRVWTFARDRYGRLRPDRGERWDAAELALIRGLEPAGFRDAFRAVHGLERRELSWEWPQWGGGYRLDHLIVSGEVRPEGVEYVHAARQAGLSDHSALLARISWSAEVISPPLRQPCRARPTPAGGSRPR